LSTANPASLRIQELTYGGLKPIYQARLDAMIEGTDKPNGAGRPGRLPRHDVHLLEGTKLLREWRGVTKPTPPLQGALAHLPAVRKLNLRHVTNHTFGLLGHPSHRAE
jgi:hypothetical protein